MADDLKDIIKTFLERKGKFQCILIFLLCLNSMTIGINHTITAFHIYVPKFYCPDNFEKYDQCSTNVNGTGCESGYIFDEEDDRSIVVEWSLICDRRLLAPLVNTMYFVGVTLGALICSTFCDIWGRKKLVLFCLYAQALLAIGLFTSNSLIMFVIFRVLQGFFIQGLQTCSYTLMLEYCPSRFRTAAAVFWEVNWAIGLGVLGGVAYFVRDWRILTLLMTIPSALSVIYSWSFPESITWLYAKGRYTEAFRLLQKIAKKNKAYDIDERCYSMHLEESNNEHKVLQKNEINSNQPEQEKTDLLSIVRCRPLKKHLFTMISIWFSVTLSYYGILYFLPSLAGQRHVNFLVGAAIEAISYILAYFVLRGFGRRLPMASYQFANSVFILAMGIIWLLEDSSLKTWSLIVISLLAKGLAVSSFCGMFIYCSELFPTVCRGLALGLCGFSARCGSLLAPQLMALTFYLPAWIPLGVMSVLLVITATLTINLPETLSSQLPNTIAEATEMWG